MPLQPASSPRSRSNASTRVASGGWKSQAFLGRFSAAMVSSNLLAGGTVRPVRGTRWSRSWSLAAFRWNGQLVRSIENYRAGQGIQAVSSDHELST